VRPAALPVTAFAIAIFLAMSASAHTRSVSYSSWELDPQGARVRARIPLLELSRLGLDPVLDVGSDGPAARYLASHLRFTAGDGVCPPSAPVALTAPKGWVHLEWRVDCESSGARAVESWILRTEAPSHMHFARVSEPGSAALERVLIEGERQWPLAREDEGSTRDAGGTPLSGYLTIGVEHILSGWDHLAFVLALLLLAGGFLEVASLVTAFTVAHSITLGLAVLGLVHPERQAVEALIGFSIALVAAENAWLLGGRGRVVPWAVASSLLALSGLAVWGVGVVSSSTLLGLAVFSACHFALLDRVERPARLRAAVAFAFGLVHGFGFAGVLAEMALPTERLVPALFGFNLGVEVGQLAVVALVWPVLRALRRSSPEGWHRGVAEVGSAAVFALGLYWFLVRTLGG
jgi:hypothetical protein